MSRYPKGSRLVKQPAAPPPPPDAIAPASPGADQLAKQDIEMEMPVETNPRNYRGLVTEFFEIGFNNSHLRYTKGAMIDADPGLAAFLKSHKAPVDWKDAQ